MAASPFEASIRRVADLTPIEEKTVAGWRLVDGQVHPVPTPAAGADGAAPSLCHDGHRYGPSEASLERGRFAAVYHGWINRRVAYLLRCGAETDVYWRIESPLRDRAHEVGSPGALAALMRELDAKGFNEALAGGVVIGSVKRKLESAVYRAGLIPTWAMVGSDRKRRLLLIHRAGEHNERPLAVLHAGKDTPRALVEETLRRELDEHGPLVPLGGSELPRPDAVRARPATSPPLVAESLTDASTRLAAEVLGPARYWDREPAWLDQGAEGALIVDRAETGREAYYPVRFDATA